MNSMPQLTTISINQKDSSYLDAVFSSTALFYLYQAFKYLAIFYSSIWLFTFIYFCIYNKTPNKQTFTIHSGTFL